MYFHMVRKFNIKIAEKLPSRHSPFCMDITNCLVSIAYMTKLNLMMMTTAIVATRRTRSTLKLKMTDELTNASQLLYYHSFTKAQKYTEFSAFPKPVD
ncbi:hypothetical protein BLOT_010760 [Blomia tropicalis]|nr:hypothetical protein BLOT_010760 [Blomia tropicalis]